MWSAVDANVPTSTLMEHKPRFQVIVVVLYCHTGCQESASEAWVEQLRLAPIMRNALHRQARVVQRAQQRFQSCSSASRGIAGSPVATFAKGGQGGKGGSQGVQESPTPMSEDFSKWYLDVIRLCELADYGPVRGVRGSSCLYLHGLCWCAWCSLGFVCV